MKKTKDDSNNVIETYTYGASRQRLKTVTSTTRTYYAWGGSKVLVEYTEAVSSSTPAYSKVYYYAGERLVSSNENGSSLDFYHHPDRLGTKVVSNSFSSSTTRQATFPFGTDFPAEGSGSPSANNLLFTSYDRSSNTGLDYAMNRTFSSGQSRFTQVDPIGMTATSIGNPCPLGKQKFPGGLCCNVLNMQHCVAKDRILLWFFENRSFLTDRRSA